MICPQVPPTIEARTDNDEQPQKCKSELRRRRGDEIPGWSDVLPKTRDVNNRQAHFQDECDGYIVYSHLTEEHRFTHAQDGPANLQMVLEIFCMFACFTGKLRINDWISTLHFSPSRLCLPFCTNTHAPEYLLFSLNIDS